MAPTYTSLPTDEEPQRARPRPRVWIKVLWVLQAVLMVLRILFVVVCLVTTMVAAAFLGAPIFVFIIVWILMGFDIWLSGFVIMQVYQQLFVDSRTHHPTSEYRRTTLRREVYKAAFATWLFLSVLSLPKDVGKGQKLNDEQKEALRKIMMNAWMLQIGLAITVVGLFYPPLWVAFRERKWKGKSEGVDEEEDEEDVELDESEIRLLDREAMNPRDGHVEGTDNDNNVKGKK